MADFTYPGGIDEVRFVDAYRETTLRKPQAVADIALRGSTTAGAADRLLLTGLIAEQLAESCRRLTAVYMALDDRTLPVGRRLMEPLPGLADWRRFVQMLRRMGISDEAMERAIQLRGQGDLIWIEPLIAAAESGNVTLLAFSSGHGGPAAEAFLGGANDAERTRLTEDDAATLADLTAEMVSIARGFLGAYVGGRRSAGRRD
jgi:hypothetical protein